MNSHENYLDDLLKSMLEESDQINEDADGTEPTADGTEPTADGTEPTADGTEPTAGDTEPMADGTEPTADYSESDIDFAIQDFGEELLEEAEEIEESDNTEDAVPEEGIPTGDSLPLELDDFAIEDFGEEEMAPFLPEEEEHGKNTDGKDINTMSLEEIDAMFAAADAAANEQQPEQDDAASEEETAGLNELLQSGNDSAIEDDMLALLESMSEDGGEEAEEPAGLPDEQGASGIPETEEVPEKNEKDSIKKEKRKKKGFLQKKKKGNTEQDASSALAETDLPDEKQADEEGEESRPKKKNFLSALLSFLTESDEKEYEVKESADAEEQTIEISEENKDILEELAAEDKKKKKKKVKGKGKKADKKASAGDLDEEDEVRADAPKKEKKKKKKGKEKTEEAEVVQKPAKKISKKNIAIIAGMNITLGAIIIVFCIVVPEYIDKRGARAAYYQADYTKSFELLFGKKLDESDNIIFNKSKTILQMKRKLDSYHNYLGMGREVQALDALLLGIEKYPQIMADAEEYNAVAEVRTIYETILNILNDKYQMSEEVAKSIVAYTDNLTYTRKIESIVNGTPFVLPGEETEGSSAGAAADILPEEQQMLEESGQETVTAAENREATQTAADSQPENNLPAENLPTENLPFEQNGSEGEVQAAGQAGEPGQGEAGAAGEVPAVTLENGSNQAGEGQMIQGIRQPLDIKIHGN